MGNYYEPSVSQFLEDGYQRFLCDPSQHTITDPSGQYVYCFDHRPSAENPKLIAMLQWQQGLPRRARVITREGDASTGPVLPCEDGEEEEQQSEQVEDQKEEPKEEGKGGGRGYA